MIEGQLEKISERLYKAVRIFADEFDDHLSFLNENIDKACETNFADEELRNSLAHRFHTIRGASSFFQLETIRDPSTEAEHLLGKDFNANDTQNLESTIKNILSQLTTEFQKVKTFLESKGI